MRFLRRTAAQTEAEPAAEAAPSTPVAGKGRPTPKRREAEGRRRGPVAPPPRTQREALRRLRTTKTKEERQAERIERRERMAAGDERYLLPRDRGPVRAYARDMVDSRRNLMGLFMPVAGLVLVSLFLNPAIQSYVSLVTAAMLMVMLVETVLLTRIVLRGARAKFPDTEIRPFGLGFYVMTRGTMLRRMRTPKPRVAYGQKIA